MLSRIPPASRILLLAVAIFMLSCVCALTPAAQGATRGGRRDTACARAGRAGRTRRHARACTRPHARAPSTKSALARHVQDAPLPPSAGAEATALSNAATVARFVATSCENTGLVPEAGNLALIRAAVLCLINNVRADHGELPLQPNAQLEAAAQNHANEMIADDYFAHVSPSGETPLERDQDSGYIPNSSVGYVIGENLGCGTLGLATPQAIVSAWVASPEHLANILNSEWVDTGIAVVAEVPYLLGEGEPGATYAQEFGVIMG